MRRTHYVKRPTQFDVEQELGHLARAVAKDGAPGGDDDDGDFRDQGHRPQGQEGYHVLEPLVVAGSRLATDSGLVRHCWTK